MKPTFEFIDDSVHGTFEHVKRDEAYVGYISDKISQVTRLVKVSEYATEAQLKMIFQMVAKDMTDFNKIAERNRRNAERLKKERAKDNKTVKDIYNIKEKPKAILDSDRKEK